MTNFDDNCGASEQLPNQPQTVQRSFPLPARSRYDRGSYVVTSANEAAWRVAQAWVHADEPALVICGPSGSGKTHLAGIIGGGDDAFVDGASRPPASADRKIAIADNLPDADPERLAQLFGWSGAKECRCVFVGAGNPGDWALGVSDLQTRLEAAPRVSLTEPDEALIRAVMSKAFADRQLRVDPAVIEYAAPRMPLTFKAAHRFVDAADQDALAENKKISIALARKVIDRLSDLGPNA
ncbi:MAG: hypothetical protein AAGC77_11550 [Pseudomonadota bacterium]